MDVDNATKTTTTSINNVESKVSIDSIESLEIFKQNRKLFIRLKLCVDQNNYYEAHQAYKTLHFRCMNNNLIDDGLELIYNGICFFLENNQMHCGFDLSKTFIETLKKSTKTVLDDTLINRISHIHKLLKNSTEERSEFTVNVLKWSSAIQHSSDLKNTQFGHPSLHREFALTFWNEKDYPASRYHFLRSCDGESCAQMLVEFQLKHGQACEVDLFIAQTVLQYLCLKNKKTANVAFENYTRLHPNIEHGGVSYALPLLNFLKFLLSAIDLGKSAVFQVLCEKYKPSIARDPTYKQYLDKIGSIYFNLQSKNSEHDNPFNSILRMFVGSDSTDSITNTNNQPSASNLFFNSREMSSLMDLEDNEDLD